MIASTCRRSLILLGVLVGGVVVLVDPLMAAEQVSTALSAGAAGLPAPQETGNMKLHWGVKIPMRDGVLLNATVYTPESQRTTAPCVVTLTPYIADSYHERGVYFARRGMTFAIVDVRGRGNSDGVFSPFIQEAKDGYDVVEWLARQAYCNGKVGMWGGSYAGSNQWATAKEFPPHLATIVPVAAPHLGTDFPMRNNIFNPYLMQWITFTSGRASQSELFSDDEFWSAFYRHWHESGRSFRDLDDLLGNPSPIFQEWLSHPEPDAYWDAYNPGAKQYGQLEIPILTITGSYDDDQPGALEYYSQYMRSASPQARARHYLIIGPWDHAGTRTPKLEVGGVKLGAASLIDLNQLHLDWYRWTMANGMKPEFLQKPVAYYETGAERWKYAETLQSVTARFQPYYLQSSSNASDVFSGGQLSATDSPARGQPDSYRFDPTDTSGPEIEAEAHTSGGSLTDQTVLFALRGKELVYHTAPFQQDTEVSGFFRLAVWISIDCPDTDLYASVYEISQDGRSIRLSTDAIRARYREGLRTPTLIREYIPLRYEFDHFTFISREVKRGARLRLVIAPMGRIIETTFAEKNYNSGAVVANETQNNGKTVTVRLVHERAHPSALYVPLGQPSSAVP